MDGDRFLQGSGHDPVGDEIGGLNPLQVETGFQDDPGQPGAADRGPEDAGIGIVGAAVAGQVQHPSVRDQQPHRADMVAEAAGAVVVLAVDIAADSPTYRDLPGAGQHRDPQPVRKDHPDQAVQRDAGLDYDRGRGRIDLQYPVQPGGIDHHAAAVLRHIAVAAAQPPGHHAATQRPAGRLGNLGDRVNHDLRVGRAQHMRAGGGSASPSSQPLGSRRDAHHLILRRSTSPAGPGTGIPCGAAREPGRLGQPPSGRRRRIPRLARTRVARPTC